jgi:hypothetical protein
MVKCGVLMATFSCSKNMPRFLDLFLGWVWKRKGNDKKQGATSRFGIP